MEPYILPCLLMLLHCSQYFACIDLSCSSTVVASSPLVIVCVCNFSTPVSSHHFFFTLRLLPLHCPNVYL